MATISWSESMTGGGGTSSTAGQDGITTCPTRTTTWTAAAR
jgi:hypothetical protein